MEITPTTRQTLIDQGVREITLASGERLQPRSDGWLWVNALTPLTLSDDQVDRIVRPVPAARHGSGLVTFA